MHDLRHPKKLHINQVELKQVEELEKEARSLRHVAIAALNILRAYGHDKAADDLLAKLVPPASLINIVKQRDAK